MKVINPFDDAVYEVLNGKHSKIANIIQNEALRQQENIELIASENYPSFEVRAAMSSVFQNKYAEGYPLARYYGGCEYIDELEAYMDSLASIGMDYDEELKAIQNQVALFEKAGCRNDDSIDECYYNKGSYSSYFSRPLNSARVTQAWGHNGHAGMDLGGNVPGTPVYAPANGTVVHTAYHQRCGGNIVYIHHQVNGKAYTTEFGHLRSYTVSPGQNVVKGQIIGYVGGDSSTWWYDSCTSGTHLHYSIAYGYYLGAGANGYNSWSTFRSNTRATASESITGIRNQAGYRFNGR